MKNSFKILTLLIIGLCAFQNILGQSNSDDGKKFRELNEKARTLRSGSKSYRIRTTQKIYVDGGKTLKTTITSISEYLAPDRWHYSSTTETGATTTKYELISIGAKAYVRENGGKWKARPTEGVYGLAAVGYVGVKLIEQTTFEGQSVSVYEETLIKIAGNEERDEKIRYWFAGTGRLLKEETESQVRGKNETSRIVSLYEYDAKDVKIEAPVK